MKKIFFVIAAISLAFISCVKENTVVTDETEGVKDFYIRGIGEDTQTKTTYTDNGTSYQFSWVANDKIAVQMVKKADGSFDSSGFVAQSINGATADFHAQGTDSYDLGDYAFYPLSSSTPNYFQYGGKLIYYGADQTDLSFLKSGTAYSTQQAESATVPTVRLYGTITENSEYPMRHIPMIGKNDGNGNFHFKAATGVLKVSFSGLPTTATQIRLDAVDYALNGYFVFDTDCEIKESYSTEGYGQKYMNFTPSSSTSRDFYFPIPTGTIPAGKLTVSVTDGTNTLYSVTNKVDITLTRGEITELPTIPCPSVSVKFTGNHQATIYFSGDVKKVSWTTAQNSVYTTRGNQSNYVTQSGTVINLGDGYSDTGIRYFGYSAYNDASATNDSDESFVVESKSAIPYYNPSLSTSVLGTYNWKQPGDRTSEVTKAGDFGALLNDAPSIIFAASDNISKGNIMITSFCGKETNKVYGFYKNESTDLVIYSSQSLFIENGVKYHMKEGYNDNVRLRLGSHLSVYGTTADMYCQGGNLYVYSGDTYSYNNVVYNISYFLADKKQ